MVDRDFQARCEKPRAPARTLHSGEPMRPAWWLRSPFASNFFPTTTHSPPTRQSPVQKARASAAVPSGQTNLPNKERGTRFDSGRTERSEMMPWAEAGGITCSPKEGHGRQSASICGRFLRKPSHPLRALSLEGHRFVVSFDNTRSAQSHFILYTFSPALPFIRVCH